MGRETDISSIAEELITLADVLRGHQNGAEGDSASISGSQLSPQNYLAMAKQAYSARRLRDQILGQAELFGEPAWDILLDLFIAYLEGKEVSVSSACIGSAAPPTTGLRWLGVLQDSGMIVREHDPRDQRRILVRLNSQGVASMEEYFRSIG